MLSLASAFSSRDESGVFGCVGVCVFGFGCLSRLDVVVVFMAGQFGELDFVGGFVVVREGAFGRVVVWCVFELFVRLVVGVGVWFFGGFFLWLVVLGVCGGWCVCCGCGVFCVLCFCFCVCGVCCFWWWWCLLCFGCGVVVFVGCCVVFGWLVCGWLGLVCCVCCVSLGLGVGWV
ncbi:hypothetical protein, partial [Neisseria sp. P0021.S004]|uniref:hypothetical protein n=1 Tax=Neisseria sp. P0021.S004 TaxID=3436819 RepID=UPI003F7DA952